MFCCTLARSRLRGVALFGFLLSAFIALYWVMPSKFPQWENPLYEHLKLVFFVADCVVVFFLALGSLTLGCAASKPPSRLVSAADLYTSSATMPRASNKRGRLLDGGLDSGADYGTGADASDSPRAHYFTAYERMGVSDPTSAASIYGRFLLTSGAAALLVAGALRLTFALREKAFTSESHKLAVCFTVIAGFYILYGISALFVLLDADPGRLPPPPQEVLRPATESAAYQAARARDGVSFNGEAPAPSSRGSANGGTFPYAGSSRAAYTGGGNHGSDFFSNAAMQSSYARQGNRY
jgi:hypothetical protein